MNDCSSSDMFHSTDVPLYDTDTFITTSQLSSSSDRSSQQRSYDTDTFVTATPTHNYSDTFESSDSRQTYQDSQSTVIESPRKSFSRYSYSESFDGSTLSGSRLSYKESSDSLSYSDTFEESDDSLNERSWTTSVTEDSEVAAEARTAEAKFLDGKYEQLVFGKDVVVSTPPPPKHKSKGERHLEKFCQRKLESIHSGKSRAEKRTKHTSSKSPKPSVDQTLVEDYGISKGQVSRLKMENLLARMKKVATAEIHSPNKCGDCRVQIAKYKQDEYLKHKTAIARRKMVDERYETLCAKDSLAIFGEMIGSLPRLTEDPDDIWEKLMAPLQARKTQTQVESPI